MNVIYKRDSDNDDDDAQSTAPTLTTSAAPEPAASDAAATEADCFEVCRVASHEGFALVPCGNARFCESCANRLVSLDSCPVCRANVTVLMHTSGACKIQQRGMPEWIKTAIERA